MKKKYFLVTDNWSVHKNADTKELHIKIKIRCIEWSSYSFDLNTIKNLWGLLKNYQNKYKNKSQTQR